MRTSLLPVRCIGIALVEDQLIVLVTLISLSLWILHGQLWVRTCFGCRITGRLSMLIAVPAALGRLHSVAGPRLILIAWQHRVCSTLPSAG